LYCIYSDKEISSNEITKEHIIPLSLGGSDEFVISVDRESNARIGSKIDGALSNDFVMQFLRKAHDLRGHSNKEVQVTLRSARLQPAGEKVRVIFHHDHVEYYDVVNDRGLDSGVRRKFESTIFVDVMCGARFTAKTLLAAGYYIYGELFRQYADHSSLRTYMNAAFEQPAAKTKNTNLRLYDPCRPVAAAHVPTYEMMREICRWLKSSCVLIMLCQDSFIGTVGIMGELIASINVPAQAEMFPNSGDYTLGQVAYFLDGHLIRKSFYDVALELGEAIRDKTHVCSESLHED
jgi:hypothetical protein